MLLYSTHGDSFIFVLQPYVRGAHPDQPTDVTQHAPPGGGCVRSPHRAEGGKPVVTQTNSMEGVRVKVVLVMVSCGNLGRKKHGN